MKRGDLVEWSLGRADGSYTYSGTVLYMSGYGSNDNAVVRLSHRDRSRLFGFYAPSKQPKTYTIAKNRLTVISPRSIYDPPRRFGPYIPVAKALP
jgi:hypothetical protein